MSNPDLAPGALQKPEPHRRLKAATARVKAAADKAIYAAVDARDGMRCRVCSDYQGYEINRHHIVYRSGGGATTTQNVISLCANCHLVGVHGGRLKLSGDADKRYGVTVLQLFEGAWREVAKV